MSKPPGFHFGHLMRQSREAAGMSQRALAQKVGLDVSYINRLESGERRPRRATLLKLASALGIKGREFDDWFVACDLAPMPLLTGWTGPDRAGAEAGAPPPQPPAEALDSLLLWEKLAAIGLDQARLRRLLHHLALSPAHHREAGDIVAATLNLVADFLAAPVHQAIIPAAGGQHRLLASHVMQHLLLQMMAEAASVGVHRFLLILAPGTEERLYRPLQTALALAVAPRFTVDYCIQPSPLGLGDAVLRARTWAAAEPVLVLLPDEMLDRRRSQEMPRELHHMSLAFQQLHQAPLIAAEPVPKSRLPQGGVVRLGASHTNPRIFLVEELQEKPSPHHPISSDPASRSIVGRYFLPPEVFAALEEVQHQGSQPLELTAALAQLRSQGAEVFAYELRTSRRDLGGVIEQAEDLLGEI